MKKLRELRKSKKGFTLIEIIVVLVIIAILAAAAIPAMYRYINDARGKAYIAEARAALVAAEYAVNKALSEGDPTTISITGTATSGAGVQNSTDLGKVAAYYADLPGNFVFTTDANGRVSKVEYTSKDGKFLVTITTAAGAVSGAKQGTVVTAITPTP